MIKISHLDHLVLTVADFDATTEFYQNILGMNPVSFMSGGGERQALEFGSQKINLHLAGHEFASRAAHPLPGSADLCLICENTPTDVIAHLEQHGITVEEGPVERTGARGKINSVYIRDPDGNLIEISSYQ